MEDPPIIVSSSPPSDHPIGSHVPVPLDQTVLTDDLKSKIIKQVEYYLGDENLPNDKFLLNYVSKNAEGFVPIGVIASFKKMKKLTRDMSWIVTALKDSTHLVVSSNGAKVKRRHPLSLSDIKDPMLCTVLVENLPDDHSLDNLRRVFGKAGKIKNISIRDPHEACDPKNRTVAERLISGRLHALVEYDTVEAAEKAAATLNNEQDWRFGLRVKLLKKGNKPGQNKKVWRESEPEKTVKVQSEKAEKVQPKKTEKVQVSEIHAVEENHDPSEQHDSHDEEDVDHLSKEKNEVHDVDHLPKEKNVVHDVDHSSKEKNATQLPKENNGNKGRNRSRGRRQKYHVTNGHGHGTHLSNHSFEPSKPPPGPKMPDGTRGFTMGRGKPLATSPQL